MLEKARAAAMVLRTPCSFCPGPDSLRARLNELWDDYAPAGEDWKRQISPVQRLHGPRRQQRALWNALTPFHGRLAPLTVYLVEYLEPVVMPVPPATCLIAPAKDPEEYASRLVAVATSLATDASVQSMEGISRAPRNEGPLLNRWAS